MSLTYTDRRIVNKICKWYEMVAPRRLVMIITWGFLSKSSAFVVKQVLKRSDYINGICVSIWEKVLVVIGWEWWNWIICHSNEGVCDWTRVRIAWNVLLSNIFKNVCMLTILSEYFMKRQHVEMVLAPSSSVVFLMTKINNSMLQFSPCYKSVFPEKIFFLKCT